MYAAARVDVYQSITARIVEQLEAGVRPWHRPWSAEHAAGSASKPLRYNGKPYQGINVLMLWLTAVERGYTCPIFLTFNQAKELGGFVRKGEKGTRVVYASTFDKKETDQETGEESVERIPFLKAYVVFNCEQVEGLPPHYYARKDPPQNLADRLDHAEAFFAATKADTRHGGNRAFYSPSEDFIRIRSVNHVSTAAARPSRGGRQEARTTSAGTAAGAYVGRRGGPRERQAEVA